MRSLKFSLTAFFAFWLVFFSQMLFAALVLSFDIHAPDGGFMNFRRGVDLAAQYSGIVALASISSIIVIMTEQLAQALNHRKPL